MARIRSSGTTDHEHTLTGEKLSLLAVFAHPEDEAFGPAGTLAKYASEGVQVSLVTASRETPASLNARVATLPRLDESLSAPPRETSCSCSTSGIRRICLLNSASGGLATQEEAMQERLVRLIREL